jgi:hypothetical protein
MHFLLKQHHLGSFNGVSQVWTPSEACPLGRPCCGQHCTRRPMGLCHMTRYEGGRCTGDGVLGMGMGVDDAVPYALDTSTIPHCTALKVVPIIHCVASQNLEGPTQWLTWCLKEPRAPNACAAAPCRDYAVLLPCLLASIPDVSYRLSSLLTCRPNTASRV